MQSIIQIELEYIHNIDNSNLIKRQSLNIFSLLYQIANGQVNGTLPFISGWMLSDKSSSVSSYWFWRSDYLLRTLLAHSRRQQVHTKKGPICLQFIYSLNRPLTAALMQIQCSVQS